MTADNLKIEIVDYTEIRKASRPDTWVVDEDDLADDEEESPCQAPTYQKKTKKGQS